MSLSFQPVVVAVVVVVAVSGLVGSDRLGRLLLLKGMLSMCLIRWLTRILVVSSCRRSISVGWRIDRSGR